MNISVSTAIAALNVFALAIAVIVAIVHWKGKLSSHELRSDIEFLRVNMHNMLNEVYSDLSGVKEELRKTRFINSLTEVVNNDPVLPSKPAKKAVAKKAPAKKAVAKKTTKNS